MKRIYLDNAATTFPKAPGLGKVMADYIENSCININRTESSLSADSFDFLFSLRSDLCDLFNFDRPDCVIFTGNVTQSMNWLIKGLLRKGDHVLVSSMEHNAVMRPLIQWGVEFDRIPSDQWGQAMPEKAQELFKDNTRAVIVSACNNVFGSIQPLEALSQVAHEHGAMLFIDSAQASPFVKIDMKKLGADALGFTGHKGFFGPQGTGGFLIRPELAAVIDPLVSGGTGSHSDSELIPRSLPDRLTSGTENLVGLCGLAHSVRWTLDNLEDLKVCTRVATEYLYKELESVSWIRIVGPSLDMPRTNVISVTCEEYDLADIASYLADNGVETRVGLHCSPSSHKTMGTFPVGTLRFSPGPFTSKEEIDTVIAFLRNFPKTKK